MKMSLNVIKCLRQVEVFLFERVSPGLAHGGIRTRILSTYIYKNNK